MKQFKTESKKLLDLVINSIYTNKDVFLRELISNASDSLDKVSVRMKEEGKPYDPSLFEIELAYDREARTVTVSDHGIGMSAAQLEEDLGTIAHSSSLEFKTSEEAGEDKDVDIIGQFGVGFYSSFMVADWVTVVSRAYGSDEANVWESDGLEGYTIKPGERSSWGTDVILHLRENSNGFDYNKFLSHPAISELVKRYSNYVHYPIVLETTGRREVPRPEGARVWEPKFEDFTERTVLNSMTPIWSKSRSEVTQEEYDAFYMKEFDDPNPPLRTLMLHARGGHSCDVLLYIPSEPAPDFYTSEFKKGLELYSSNVMIQENCSELLPECFGFLRGVVDSPSISLNLSRESISEDQFIKAIASQIQKRVHTELENMRDHERETYIDFFGKFGRIFKFAIYATFGASNELLEDLLMFFTAKEDVPVTLKEYVAKMPSNQSAIYFASGDAAQRLEASPSVTAVTSRGFDVLLCTENVDEFCLMTLREYSSIPIKNVTADDLGLEDEDQLRYRVTLNHENRELFDNMKKHLGGKVVEVGVTTNLSEAPACISAKGPVSLGMEKYFASAPAENGTPRAQHVLELNPNHHIFATLQKAQAAGDDELICSYATILYDQSKLAEGLPIDDMQAYAQAVYSLM